MSWFTVRRARIVSYLAALGAFSLPRIAGATWGQESWGTMIWGAPPLAVPALPATGQLVVVALLGAVAAVALGHRSRGRRPGR